MANAAYTTFKSGLPAADYDLAVASIKAMLVRGYAFDAANVTFPKTGKVASASTRTPRPASRSP